MRPLGEVAKQGATVAPFRTEQMAEEIPGKAVRETRKVSTTASRWPCICGT